MAEQEATIEEVMADENLEDLNLPAVDAGPDDLEVVIADEEPAPESEPAAEPAAPAAEAQPAEEPAAAADVTDADLEESDKAYPEPIKKRIKREIRIRKRVEAEFEQVREAAIQVAQLAQSREQELNAANQALKNLQRQHAEVLEVTFDKEIQLKSAELRRARDSADQDAEFRLQGELDGLRFKQNQVKEARRNMGSAPEQPAAPQPAAQPAAAAPQPAAQPTAAKNAPAPGAVKWIDANKSWFLNPKFAGHASFVRGVDQQLAKEGYSPQSQDYYVELDRRIDEAFPTLRKAAPTTATTTSPVAAVPNGAAAPRAAAAGGKRSVTLTKVDLANMQRFGLDPNNKEHLMEYARNKRAAA